MPQITSCPECSKKLRVPDDLIGKKVKCPGCATMFIAEADEPEEEAPAPAPKKAPTKAPPPKPAPERPRSEAVTSSPRAKRRDEDEDDEEAPRSRGKDRDDEEDEAPPRRGRSEGVSTSRSKRDVDEDAAPRSRGRDRDEDDDDRKSRRRDEDDRPSRRGRDDDDDDDDRPSRRRRRDDDEADSEEQARGWQKARTGMNFVAIGGWLYMSLIGLYVLAAGVLLLMGGGMLTSLFGGGGTPAGVGNSAGAMLVLGCGFMIVVGLLGLTSFILTMTGVGFCMATPQLRGQSMKGLAMTAFFLYIGGIVGYLFGSVIGSISLSMLFVGSLINIASLLAMFAGHIIWMVYLRSVCMYFRDTSLAGVVMTNLIAQIAGPVVGGIIIFLLALIIGFSGGGAGFIIVGIFYGLFVLAMLGVMVWYILTLQKVRDLVEYKADQM